MLEIDSDMEYRLEHGHNIRAWHYDDTWYIWDKTARPQGWGVSYWEHD